ncbi:ankyrin, partial [Panus rudis PR-1116 ss-1]
SSLFAACYVGSLDIDQLLLEKGANVNLEDGIYRNAFQAACAGRYRDIVKLLLDDKADPNILDKIWNCSSAACAQGSGDIDIIQLLLDKGAELSVTGGQYGSALQAAFVLQ